MKTRFEEIVDVSAIGQHKNTRSLNELLKLANQENLRPAHKNPSKNLVIGIDVQIDFMEGGALGVGGSLADTERFSRFIYDNMDEISDISVSIDTHQPFQIFHPCWWIDATGNNPDPFTVITIEDVENGKWTPVIMPNASIDYLKGLKTAAKKDLVIWPYHCIEGTVGHALENQFSNMIYFFSAAKKSVIVPIVKGKDPSSEMYGIFKPEYSKKNYINIEYLNKLETYDKIIVAGQAKSHCVLESIRQMLEHYAGRPEVTSKVYILEDCMSIIPGFEAVTEQTFESFKKQYKVNIVKAADLKL